MLNVETVNAAWLLLLHTVGIYRLRMARATGIVAGALLLGSVPVNAQQTQSLLWSQAAHMASGEAFLTQGFGRGVEIWNWPSGATPTLFGRHERAKDQTSSDLYLVRAQNAGISERRKVIYLK